MRTFNKNLINRTSETGYQPVEMEKVQINEIYILGEKVEVSLLNGSTIEIGKDSVISFTVLNADAYEASILLVKSTNILNPREFSLSFTEAEKLDMYDVTKVYKDLVTVDVDIITQELLNKENITLRMYHEMSHPELEDKKNEFSIKLHKGSVQVSVSKKDDITVNQNTRSMVLKFNDTKTLNAQEVFNQYLELDSALLKEKLPGLMVHYKAIKQIKNKSEVVAKLLDEVKQLLVITTENVILAEASFDGDLLLAYYRAVLGGDQFAYIVRNNKTLPFKVLMLLRSNFPYQVPAVNQVGYGNPKRPHCNKMEAEKFRTGRFFLEYPEEYPSIV